MPEKVIFIAVLVAYFAAGDTASAWATGLQITSPRRTIWRFWMRVDDSPGDEISFREPNGPVQADFFEAMVSFGENISPMGVFSKMLTLKYGRGFCQ